MDIGKTIFVAFIGFLLTGVVGTWISYFWQTRNWRLQQDYLRNKELLSKQVEIVEGLADLVGQRKFRMFRAAAALRGLDSEKISTSWKSYDASVILWNDSVNGYITKLRQFFTKRMQYDLDSYITEEFQYIGSILERSKKNYDIGNIDMDYYGNLKEISERLENFNGHINEYIGTLWSHIDGLKERIDGKNLYNISDRDNLSNWHLFKQIFVLRKQF
ncbi:MAG: hypothetical protein J0I98_06140 [Mesorhizobium sp.]|nr:hypothetical protein [Mesorhizobium sp.]MBN9242356.1 hypothetical protein [Mesorhizobium sp.]